MRQIVRIRALLAVALMSFLCGCGGGQVLPTTTEGAPGTESGGAAAPPQNPGGSNTGPGASSGSVVVLPSNELDQPLRELEASGATVKLDRSDSLLGPDVNKNGVRDDLDAWIASQPVTDKQTKALMQEARMMQSLLQVDLTNQSALKSASDTLMASGNCLFLSFDDRTIARAYARRIEAFTANTNQRAREYARYNSAQGGSVTELPLYDTCEP